MSSDGVIVRFIKNCEDRRALQLLDDAFMAIREISTDGVWFGEGDCMKLVRNEKNILYVFGKFEGDAFNRVKSLEMRTYGAPCILRCLEAGEALPKPSHPVYSLAMKGIIISCTNIPTEKRNDIHEKVEWMMGETSRVMNEKVNCLVAGEVGSKKYLVAAAGKTRVMLPEWVENVWQESLSSPVHGTDKKYEKFRCPVFMGFSVCVSGLSSDARNKIKSCVESEGGKFNGMMKVNECTHLILNEPSGQKYQFAKQWKILTVRPEWVFDSMAEGYYVQEGKYLMIDDDDKRNSRTTSTPNGKDRNDCNVSTVSNLSVIAKTHINETECTFGSDVLGRSLHRPETPCPLDSLDVRRANSDDYLDGCKIYVSGATLENSDKVRIIINKGNGMRFSQLNETVSHVVTTAVSNLLLQQMEKLQNRPHVVSPLWLIECFKTGKCVQEEKFSLMSARALPSVEQFSPQSKGSKSCVARTHAKSFNRSNNPGKDMETASVLSQYAGSNGMHSRSELGESTMRMAMQGVADMSVQQNELRTMNESKMMNTIELEHTLDCNAMFFSGLTFIVFHLEFLEELTREIEEHGGKVLPANTKKLVNFGVVPIEGCPVTRTVDEVVTTAWVSSCVEELKLLPSDSLEIFRPITILPNCRPLRDCVLSISGLQGMEKNIIGDILGLLGGSVQDCFVRVRKENFLACTHLVANSAEGQKYEAAVKWGIPVVTKSWVFECARTGKKAPEKFHYFGQGGRTGSDTSIKNAGENRKTDSAPKKTLPKKARVLNEEIKSVQDLSRRFAECPATKVNPVAQNVQSENNSPANYREPPKNARVQALIEDNKPPNNDTPSKFLNADHYQPHFNFQNSLSPLMSPAVPPKRNSRISLPLEQVFAENITIAVKNSTGGQTGNESYSQECPNAAACIEQVENDRPLAGVVISVGKKLIKNQMEYNKMAAELGAQYRWMYQHECTHFIFQGKPNDTNREFRTAREQGKIIISPHWLLACHEQKKRVDESLFPHTFNANMSLSAPGNKTPLCPQRTQKKVQRGLSGPDPSLPPEEDQSLDVDSNLQNLKISGEKKNPTSHTKGFLDDLKKLTEASRSNLKDRPQKTESTPNTGERVGKTRNVKARGNNYTQASQVEVMWDDPLAREDIAKLAESSVNTRSKDVSMKCIEPPPTDYPDKPRVYNFLLTGFIPQERQEFARVVESLGGSVVDETPETCTHLVSNTPSRSEKFLACVSSGKWVLHKSYLAACTKAGQFVEEEDFEWGSQSILNAHRSMTPQEHKLAVSARVWRLKLQGGKEKLGAFEGWRCLIITDQKKLEGFSRLLMSGGASVVPNKEPLNLQGMTHAFIDLKHASSPANLEKMVTSGIHCLKPEYIANCLIDQPQPEPKSFYIPEALQILSAGASKKRHSDSPLASNQNKSRKLR